MNLPTEIFGDVVVVHAPEELSLDQADQLPSLLTSLDRSNVVFDLDSTEVLDSAGLESLLRSQQALSELGGDIKIATTNETNRKILEITRLDQTLEVFEGVLDAVTSYAQ